MRVLVTVDASPTQKYLVKLPTHDLISEVIDLIKSRKHHEAIMLTLARGDIEREISDCECHCIKADLILSKSNARWDLLK